MSWQPTRESRANSILSAMRHPRYLYKLLCPNILWFLTFGGVPAEDLESLGSSKLAENFSATGRELGIAKGRQICTGKTLVRADAEAVRSGPQK